MPTPRCRPRFWNTSRAWANSPLRRVLCHSCQRPVRRARIRRLIPASGSQPFSVCRSPAAGTGQGRAGRSPDIGHRRFRAGRAGGGFGQPKPVSVTQKKAKRVTLTTKFISQPMLKKLSFAFRKKAPARAAVKPARIAQRPLAAEPQQPSGAGTRNSLYRKIEHYHRNTEHY